MDLVFCPGTNWETPWAKVLASWPQFPNGSKRDNNKSSYCEDWVKSSVWSACFALSRHAVQAAATASTQRNGCLCLLQGLGLPFPTHPTGVTAVEGASATCFQIVKMNMSFDTPDIPSQEVKPREVVKMSMEGHCSTIYKAKFWKQSKCCTGVMG